MVWSTTARSSSDSASKVELLVQAGGERLEMVAAAS
jgi:hypothetical protein